MSDTLEGLLAEPWWSKGVINPRLLREAPTLLGQAMLREKALDAGRVEAFALAVRALTELEPFYEDRALTAKQTAALQKLSNERGVPPFLASWLRTVQPRLLTTRDVVTAYGLLRGALEFITHATALTELEQRRPTLSDPRKERRR